MSLRPLVAVLVSILAVPVGAAPIPKGPAPSRDWPMNGGTPSRNMVNFRNVLPNLPPAGPDWENADAVDTMEELSGVITPAAGLRALRAVAEARRRISANVAPQLALEVMLFDIQEVCRCPR
jgi:hypothetical protein